MDAVVSIVITVLAILLSRVFIKLINSDVELFIKVFLTIIFCLPPVLFYHLVLLIEDICEWASIDFDVGHSNILAVLLAFWSAAIVLFSVIRAWYLFVSKSKPR